MSNTVRKGKINCKPNKLFKRYGEENKSAWNDREHTLK